MGFNNSFRLERVYFEKLKSQIETLKKYFETESDAKTKAILENGIDDNGAILLLYRNLGEAWAELSDLIKKAEEKTEATEDQIEKYHEELNQRIDEVNNYIMVLIRELEQELENKQERLISGNGINIEDSNKIRSTLLETKNYSNISGLNDYRFSNVTQVTYGNPAYYYGLKLHFEILATGAVLKENLHDAHSIRFVPTFRMTPTGGSAIDALLSQGDGVIFHIGRVECNQGLIPCIFKGQGPTIIKYGTAENQSALTVDNMEVHLLGVSSYIQDFEDETEYSIFFDVTYIPLLNGKIIGRNSPNMAIVTSENYVFSGFTMRKYIS